MLAPNEYKIPTVLGHSKEGKIRSAPAFTIVSRKPTVPDSRLKYPAPGTYDIEFNRICRRPPQYSMGQLVGAGHIAGGPGPGAHCPEKVAEFN